MMNVGIFSALVPLRKHFLAPPQTFHRMVVANAEKLVTAQMVSHKRYADLGLAQWRAIAQVEDPDTLLQYVIKQGECVIKGSEQFRSDVQKVSQIGVDFLFDVHRSVQENFACAVTERDRKASNTDTRKAA